MGEMLYTSKEKSFLLWSHVLAFTIHLISSLLSFDKASELPLTNANITIATHKYMASPPYAVIESTILVTTQPVILIAYNELITCISHGVAIVIFYLNRDIYGVSPRTCESVRRWGSYAITAGLLQIAMILSVGPASVFLVIFMIVSNVLMQATGFFIDQTSSVYNRIVFGIFGTVLLATAMIFVAMRSTRIEGLEFNTLAIDYDLMTVVYGLFYVSFGIVMWLRQMDGFSCTCNIKKIRTRCCSYLNADGIFVLLSITSKVALSWFLIPIVFTGLDQLKAIETSTDWPTVQLGVFISVIALLLIGIGINYYVFHVEEKEIDEETEYSALALGPAKKEQDLSDADDNLGLKF
jgi:cbb3-type cytochrome oxidase subunit 3